MRKFVVIFIVFQTGLLAQERSVEPTWLHRDVAVLRERSSDLSSSSCHYTPIFGEGDEESRFPISITRFGKLTVDPQGVCPAVAYPRQEELYYALDGRGVLHYEEKSRALAGSDFTYVAPTVRHGLSNSSKQPFRLIVVTVKIPSDTPIVPPGELVVANLRECQCLRQDSLRRHRLPDTCNAVVAVPSCCLFPENQRITLIR